MQRVDEGRRETYALRMRPASLVVAGAVVPVLGLEGSVPGPVLKVPEGVSVEVRLDGAGPPVTLFRSPVARPGTYLYRPQRPVVGADVGAAVRLYGLVVVEPSRDGYWPSVDSERFIVLDDLSIGTTGAEPLSSEPALRAHAMLGRTNNTLLANGRTEWEAKVRAGEVVRVHIANAAPTRTFRLRLPGASLKLIGSGAGRVELEEIVDEVRLVPGARAVIDMVFVRPGRHRLENRLPGRSLPVATFDVGPAAGNTQASGAFAQLRENTGFGHLRLAFDELLARSPDATIVTDAVSEVRPAPFAARGGVAKLRLFNRTSLRQPRSTLVRLEGERFIVLSRDGAPNRSFAWADTLLLRAGEVVDLLLEPSAEQTFDFQWRDSELPGASRSVSITACPDAARLRDGL